MPPPSCGRNHYDALAIAASPKAPPEDDITDFNPRTKRGKMILAAAQKLVSSWRAGRGGGGHLAGSGAVNACRCRGL